MRTHSKIVVGILVILALCGGASLFVPLPHEDFRKESVHSMRIVDRNGILLREYLNDAQGRGQWRSIDDMAPALRNATIAVEDKRFRYHPGIDPFAIVRAIGDNLHAGRLRSGGSTLTQQVIRNVYHHPRTLFSKVLEAWYALRLERMLTKDEILEHYLNRVPYGNQLTGAEAASRYYFNKPARDLSIAEAAFLAGLPNAPSMLNPYSNRKQALARQIHVLRAMLHQKFITEEQYRIAERQPITIVPAEVNFRAPHLVEMAAREVAGPGTATVYTTIDYPLQSSIQWLVKGHLTQLKRKNVSNASVVVIENKSMEIRALVGSADYFGTEIQGQVNGALARRQPGSSVKPFTYGLALEGPMTAADVIPDVPTRIPDQQGDYIPENYDRRYHGPVRLRTALACSYNIPAVRTLRQVGRENLLQRLLQAGLTMLDQPSVFYGYGLTLGNGEVTLFQLSQAYAAFANGGLMREATFWNLAASVDGSKVLPVGLPPRRIFSEQVSWLVTSILIDGEARRPAFGHAFHFPFECAVKTGTTKDYRDNWTLGYTTTYTVGVWVGNFDGTPMKGVSGVTGAGQIFEDVMMLLHLGNDKELPPAFPRPGGLVKMDICPVSGKLPSMDCPKAMQEWFLPDRVPEQRCTIHRTYRIVNDRDEPETKLYEIYPVEYREWAEEQNVPLPPPGAIPIGPPALPSAHRLALLAPHQGQLFKIDPILRREFQAVRILAQVPSGVTGLHVKINGHQDLAYESGGTWWQLEKGEHRIQLEGFQRGKTVRSDQVVITVE